MILIQHWIQTHRHKTQEYFPHWIELCSQHQKKLRSGYLICHRLHNSWSEALYNNLTIPWRTMRPSAVCISEPLAPWCSQQTYHCKRPFAPNHIKMQQQIQVCTACDFSCILRANSVIYLLIYLLNTDINSHWIAFSLFGLQRDSKANLRERPRPLR